MRTLLLRSFLLLVLLLGFRALPASASHLFGGEMKYRYLGSNGPANAPFRYEISVFIYVNTASPATPPDPLDPSKHIGKVSAPVNFYNKSQNNSLIFTINIPRTSYAYIVPPSPGGCPPAGGSPPLTLVKYIQVVNLPVSFSGYYATFTDIARNNDVTNILNPGNTNMTLFVDMAPPLIPNSSPSFSDTAVAVICAGDTSIILNNAFDADGDRLIYSFGVPYQGSPGGVFNPPPAPITYFNNTYSVTRPFGSGPGNYAALNASTGLGQYAAPAPGNFAVAVDVKEYRTINGQEILVGSTRRDIQLVARTCLANNAPVFSSTSTPLRNFTIEEGQSLSFNLAATDPDGNQSISIRVNSALLDGSGGFDATFNNNPGTVLPGNPTGTANVTATGTVSGLFRFNSTCGTARRTPYDVVVTITDNVCGSKSRSEVFQILVNKGPSPTKVDGDSVICDRNQVRTYSALGPAANSYRWTVLGGTVQGPATGNTVQVIWNGTGAGRVVAKGVSSFGCLSDSATRNVDIRPSSSLAVSPSTNICLGSSTTLTATGGQNFTWTGGNQTFTGPSITVSPTQTTTYTVTSTDGVCTATRQVTVTVNPLPVVNAGANRTVCSGETTTLGSAAVAGQTYQWSPATGLSSSTAAQPTFSMTNTGPAPIVQTYMVTATTTQGCTATSTVTITVNPAATADAGPNRAVCSGESTVLGTAASALPQTYSWSPATGLSSATAAQPTFLLTNTTSAPQTYTYTLTTTTDAGCTATSTVTVTVNQAAVAVAGINRAVCSGESTTLGSAAVAGQTYSWSPATGLSSATAAQPTFLLNNTTSAPIVQTYTLTATTAQGCTATSTVTVTVNPAAVADAGPARTFCSGGTASLGNAASVVAGTTYAWSPATGLSSATSATPSVTLTNTGPAPITQTYTLTTTTDAGCTATSTVTVTVNQAAVANAGTNRAVCSGETTTLGSAAVAGQTYQWSPATGLSSSTAAQPVFEVTNTTSAPQTFTYTLTATTAQGCTATSAVTVTVNQAAQANAGTNRAVCSGESTTLGSAAVAGQTYQWSPAANLSSATSAQPVFQAINMTSGPQTFTYTVTATTAQGCVATSTVTVTVNQAAQAVAGTSRAVCSGETTTLGSAAVAGQTYSWSPATGLSSATAAQPTFLLTNTGPAPIVQTYTLTATTAQGCTATSTVTITVNPAAIANAGPNTAVCDAKQVTLGTPALAGQTYSWSPATNLSSTTAAQPVLTGVNTTANPITLTYTLTARTALNCTSTSTVQVVVNPRPAADSIQGTRSVCPTVQGVAYSIRSPRGSAYTWLISGGTIASGQGTSAVTVNWGAANANASISAFRLNAQGCSSDTITLPVRINQLLNTATPTGPLRVCQADGPFTYQTTFTNGSVYAWELVGATQVSTNQSSVVVNFTRPGIAKLVVTETSNPAGGVVRCFGRSDTLYVNVLPSPAANLAIAGPARVCSGSGPVSFSLPGATGSAYQFTLNGAPVTATGNTASFPAPTLPAGSTAPVAYTLTARETNASGCVGTVYTRQFLVDPTPLALTVTGPASVCPESGPLTYSVTGQPGSTFAWTVTGGTIATGQGTNTITVTFAAGTGAKSVAVTETSSFGCGGAAVTRVVSTDNVSLALNATSVEQDDRKVTLNLAAANNTGNTNRVNILRKNAGSTGPFTAVTNVPNTTTSFTDNSVDADAQAYTYRIELTNSCGTVLNSTEHTTMRAEAVVTETQQGRNEGKVKVRWNAYQGFTVSKYEVYRTADGGTPELVATVTTGPLETELATTSAGFNQEFRVKAISTGTSPLSSFSNGASITFDNKLQFYNVITPNGDGLNDALFIDNVALYPGNTLTIFNRWGKEVFNATNYNNNWQADGQPAGVYYYLFKQSNGSSYKGWVEVVK
ncbi:gliding motility-associated C-terminal domain-containing protein [Hymenobacter sp. BT175]|uniref:T9SS type B sorting domain-containing protein n=1 Tax=Hymenobacter translucens TaxID=2886507 RepID=UPI001D0E1084|nr:gliding motility-associated C-terminal domain-containing protein [Hymenobacter translucens]MCC2546625.1 gliding motility-associated C-terminal domain-containing protein [Hymenobacter translucens]